MEWIMRELILKNKSIKTGNYMKICNACFRVMIAVTVILVSSVIASATQPADSAKRYIHHLGADLRVAYIAPARSAVENTYLSSSARDVSASAHIKYSFTYPSASREGRLYPGAYQGVGVGGTTFFDNSRTGMPVSAYLFQGAPIVRLAPNLTFGYEWNFGVAFGWKKYNDDLYPPVNLIVGSPVNAYINLGFLLTYRLDRNWSLTAGIDLTHYSNGNTSLPNPGVNSIGGRVGVTRTFDSDDALRTLVNNSSAGSFRPHISYDLVAYGAVRKKVVNLNGFAEIVPGHFGIAGLNFTPMYNFNRFLRAGVSLDVQYDESSDLAKHWVEGSVGDYIKFYRPSFFDQVSCGLSARGELVMPIFSINAGMGYNIIGNNDTKNFYQVLALKIHLAKSFYVHIGYQLNSFKNPNNLMIGLGYRFHDKR